MTRQSDKNKVIVVWAPYGAKSLQDLADRGVGLLTCREGVRVFSKDKLDGRCGDLPFFTSLAEGFSYAVKAGAGPGAPFQLALTEARANGLTANENLVVFS